MVTAVSASALVASVWILSGLAALQFLNVSMAFLISAFNFRSTRYHSSCSCFTSGIWSLSPPISSLPVCAAVYTEYLTGVCVSTSSVGLVSSGMTKSICALSPCMRVSTSLSRYLSFSNFDKSDTVSSYNSFTAFLFAVSASYFCLVLDTNACGGLSVLSSAQTLVIHFSRSNSSRSIFKIYARCASADFSN